MTFLRPYSFDSSASSFDEAVGFVIDLWRKQCALSGAPSFLSNEESSSSFIGHEVPVQGRASNPVQLETTSLISRLSAFPYACSSQAPGTDTDSYQKTNRFVDERWRSATVLLCRNFKFCTTSRTQNTEEKPPDLICIALDRSPVFQTSKGNFRKTKIQNSFADERWRSAAVPLRIRCASDPPARARALSALPVNDRLRAFSDGVLLLSRQQRSKQSFAVRTTSGPLRGYWDKPESKTQRKPEERSGEEAEEEVSEGKGTLTGGNGAETGGNGAGIEEQGRWPGLVNVTPPVPEYELGRERGPVKVLKRQRSGDGIKREELRPLPGRFHVAMSPDAMRGRITARTRGT